MTEEDEWKVRAVMQNLNLENEQLAREKLALHGGDVKAALGIKPSTSSSFHSKSDQQVQFAAFREFFKTQKTHLETKH